MTKDQLLNLLKTKKQSEIDLTGVNLEGIKSNLKHVDKNEIIFRPGDRSDSIYFVINGEVMLSNGDDITTIEEKQYFGLDALNPNKKQNAKAIAIKPGMILEIVLHEKSQKTISTEVGKLNANQFLSKPSKKLNITSEGNGNTQNLRDYESETIGDVVLIKVKIKKAILTNAKSFLKYINKAIVLGKQKFIVDLTYCEIIDSTFLGVLVKALKSAAVKNGEIVLIYDQSQSSTLFMITYMDKVFKIFNNKEEALEYFEKK